MNWLLIISSVAAVAFTIGAATGLIILGYYLRDIKEQLKTLIKREPEPQRPSVVNPLPPDYVNLTKNSAVVTPKSPQQLEREQEARMQALR